MLTNVEDFPLEVYFGLEFNFGLLSGDSPERFYEFKNVHVDDRSMMSEGELKGLTGINLVDTWAGLRVVLSWNVPSIVWRYPVQTVSLSESGFERLYQCSSIPKTIT
jgi:alpha-amylase